jgi:cytochrome c
VLVAQGAKPPQPPQPSRYGIGRAATPDEIKKLDIDVSPDGTGLPEGRGTVAEGAPTYAAQCASCHRQRGEGASFAPPLATCAGESVAVGRDRRLAPALGNYWPYSSALYDCTARSMPFAAPGTLTANEVYGLVAYLLSLNKVVPETAVMDQTTLPKVVMPARDRFVKDNRTGGRVVK